MRILVLGAGGVGGYFGGRLVQAGVDTTFLVRERRQAQLRANGLVLQSPKGDAVLPVTTILAAELGPGYDWVLLTCKAFDLDSAMDAIAPAVSGGCAVLPLLNGISHLDRLDARFGRDHVLGGSCQIAATLAPDGTVRHLNDVHRILYGERDGADSPRIAAIDSAFKASGVEAKRSVNVMADLWEKAAFLCTLAAMTTLMRASVGEIAATPDGPALMQRLGEACRNVAAKAGYPLSEPAVERMNAVLMNTNSPLSASMLRDLQAGGRTEADHIVGFMLNRAREYGVDDSLLAVAYTHLRVYEAARGRHQ